MTRAQPDRPRSQPPICLKWRRGEACACLDCLMSRLLDSALEARYGLTPPPPPSQAPKQEAGQ